MHKNISLIRHICSIPETLHGSARSSDTIYEPDKIFIVKKLFFHPTLPTILFAELNLAHRYI